MSNLADEPSLILSRTYHLGARVDALPRPVLAHSCRQRGRPPRQLSGAKLPLIAFRRGPASTRPLLPITAILGSKKRGGCLATGPGSILE